MGFLSPRKKWWQFWKKRCARCGGGYMKSGGCYGDFCLPCSIKFGYEIGAIAPDDPKTPAAYRTILSQMLSLGILNDREHDSSGKEGA